MWRAPGPLMQSRLPHRLALMLPLLWGVVVAPACTRSAEEATEVPADPCPILHKIDGAFTGWPDTTDCAEWADAPIKGVFGDLYIAYDNKRLYVLNDWHLRSDAPIGPTFYNEFTLATGDGEQQWVVKVFGDDHMEVTLDGDPYDISTLDKAAAGFGPSPNHATPHTIYEFVLGPVSKGPIVMTEKDPPGGPLTNPEGDLVAEPTGFVGTLGDDGAQLTASDGPVLVAATPQQRPPGTKITLVGLDFGAPVGKVLVGNQLATIVDWRADRAQFVLPAVASPTQIRLETAAGKASNSVQYRLTCVPDCNGLVCGDDGCGGSCGTCPTTKACAVGQCVCPASCVGRECGDDNCGGSCGKCTAPEICTAQGKCICDADCSGKDCGDNGCGGSCGTCSAGLVCNGDNCIGSTTCTADCSDKVCGDDGCGGTCGACKGNESCTNGACGCAAACKGKACGSDGCGGDCGTCSTGSCFADQCCVADCVNKVCGGDGCGGSCGDCPAKQGCLAGACVCKPDCGGKQCGDDGCGGTCGSCTPWGTCNGGLCACSADCEKAACGSFGCGDCGKCVAGKSCVSGACACVPDCAGKQCGEDGCGGSCGQCGAAQVCTKGFCKCVPDCVDKACGGDGCGGSCGACGPDQVCGAGKCVCAPQCQDKVCGEDGCGGSCGACEDKFTCSAGKCVAK